MGASRVSDERANDELLGYLIRNIHREQSRARSTMPQGEH
jgi:hypothetical protein